MTAVFIIYLGKNIIFEFNFNHTFVLGVLLIAGILGLMGITWEPWMWV